MHAFLLGCQEDNFDTYLPPDPNKRTPEKKYLQAGTLNS